MNFIWYTDDTMSNATIISSGSPLKRIMQAVNAIEKGEYHSDLLSDFSGDSGELGQLARTLDALTTAVSLRDTQLKLLKRVIPIGVSLSAEKDFNRLLETLVIEAQSFTNADAGTLYLLENDALKFVILRNKSLNLRMGGTSGNPIEFYPVRLHNKDGSENRSNVVSYAALTKQRVNIVDAYEAEGFDFSGTKAFDARTGYRSKSFLTIPLKNTDEEVIGVLQLINAKNRKDGLTIAFTDDDALEALILLATAALDGYIREEELRQEIAKLKIVIDQSRRERQVAEITETEFFRDLQDKAKDMRSRTQK